MILLRKVARGTSELLGRDSLVIRAARPAYDWMLDAMSGGSGIWQPLNGRERFRIDPYHRHHFPEVKDPEVCAYLRAHVRPGDVAINVGAHVGIYALCLAHWSGPNGRVLALEPNPRTREILTRHVALNGLADRVEVLAEAAADVPGRAEFFADGTEGVSRLSAPNPYWTPAALRPVTVPVTTVDQVCAARGLRPNWVLVDVEGFEARVLAGARRTLGACRGQLNFVVEMHPNVWASAGTSRADFAALLADLRLDLQPLTGQTRPLDENGIVLLRAL